MAETKTVDQALADVAEVIKQKRTEGNSRPDAQLAADLTKSLEAGGILRPNVPTGGIGIARPSAGFSTDPDPGSVFGRRGLPVMVRKRLFEDSEIKALAGDIDRYMEKRATRGDDFVRQYQRWNDDVLLASVALADAPANVLKRATGFRAFLEEELLKGTSELSKAMAAGTSGAGLEWVPTVFSPDLLDLVRVARVLLAQFSRRTMRGETERLPQYTQEMAAYVISESTTNSIFTVPGIISDLTTANLVVNAVELIVAAIWSKTFEEASIIDSVPQIRQRIVEALAKGIEDAIINGSLAGTHPDADVANTSPGPTAKAWNGLRATAMGTAMTDLAGTTDLSAANMTAANLLRLKLLQGRFGANDRNNIWVTSPQGIVKLAGLKDSVGSELLMTLERYGQQAVLLTGVQNAVASLAGSAVIVSDLVKTNLDANGVVLPTPSNKTQLIRANVKAFEVFDRRALTIENDSLPLVRQRVLVATERMVFLRTVPGQSAADRPVTIGLNIETV